ncbi:hypothetical protein CAPTEDRAFT_29667, partial [Capitella teleta]
MASLVQRIASQAARTFRNTKNPATFQQQLIKLKELTRTLTADDINFDVDLVRDTRKFNPESGEAPFTYIGLWEDKIFSMGVFVLRSHTSLPIHDHPDMFGMVKVLNGSVNVKSFSKVVNNDGTDLPKDEVMSSTDRVLHRVHLHGTQKIGTSDGVCVLDPLNGNFHEVSTGETPGAFFDILSPPYD